MKPKPIYRMVENVEVKSIDEASRTIWHTITREVPDRMGDVVEIDGVDTQNFARKPAVLYGHSYGGVNPVPVIAENVGFKRDEDRLLAGTRFLPTDGLSVNLADLINDLWALNVKGLMGWSIGFLPDYESAENIVNGKGRITGRRFKKAELLEYSNVIIPCHQDALRGLQARGLLDAEWRFVDAGDETPVDGASTTDGFPPTDPPPPDPAPVVTDSADAAVTDSESFDNTDVNTNGQGAGPETDLKAELQGISPEDIRAAEEKLDRLIAARRTIIDHLRQGEKT